MGRIEKTGGKNHAKSDAHEFWDDIGVDLDSPSPKGEAVAGAVTGSSTLCGSLMVEDQ